MRVKLLACTPDAERLIAAAARLCYSSRTVGELLTDLTPAEVSRLIRMLRKSEHMSVFEHATFTFAVEGLSRTALAQLTRHRLVSFSVQSQRHVRSVTAGMIMPPSISRDPVAHNLLLETIERMGQAYDALISRGIPREDARFCLPGAAPTSLIMTLNARELMWVARQRMCHTSQWEIRRAVTHMVRQARKVAPVVFEEAGPPCRTGKCPEHHECKLRQRFHRWRKFRKDREGQPAEQGTD